MWLTWAQAELGGGMFTFGTLDTEVEGWREAVTKGKEENQRIDDMKDSIGDETFEMINEQLASMGARAVCARCMHAGAHPPRRQGALEWSGSASRTRTAARRR